MTENGTHPQDPAEGPDDDQQQGDDRATHPQQPAEGGDAERQNEQRELNNGDDVTQPGGDEPTD